MSDRRDRIVTPTSDPGRWGAEEIKLFNAGRCSWQVSVGRVTDTYCGQPSKPGASFGHCAGHDKELLETCWPDGSPRR